MPASFLASASAALTVALATLGAEWTVAPLTIPTGSELLLSESDVGLAKVPTEVFLGPDSGIAALADPEWYVDNADPNLRLWIGARSEDMSGEPFAIGSDAAQLIIDNLNGSRDDAGCWIESPPTSETPLFRAFGGEEDAVLQVVLEFVSDENAERFLSAWSSYDGLVDDWDDRGFISTTDDPSSSDGSQSFGVQGCGPLWAPPAEDGFEAAVPCASVALCWRANIGDDEFPFIVMAARRDRFVTLLSPSGSVDGEQAMTAAVGRLDNNS